MITHIFIKFVVVVTVDLRKHTKKNSHKKKDENRTKKNLKRRKKKWKVFTHRVMCERHSCHFPFVSFYASRVLFGIFVLLVFVLRNRFSVLF